MSKVLLATKNKGKLAELQELTSGMDIEIISLDDLDKEIPTPEETGQTFEENALEKAKYYSEKSGLPVIADDSGLEVDSLDKRPGIYSARYIEGTDEDRYKKILEELKDINNRTARFRCAVAYVDTSKNIEKIFDGTVEGGISYEPKGTNGFGYDPIFIPEGYNKTFAELGSEVKNKFSHRAKAIEKLVEWMKNK